MTGADLSTMGMQHVQPDNIHITVRVNLFPWLLGGIKLPDEVHGDKVHRCLWYLKHPLYISSGGRIVCLTQLTLLDVSGNLGSHPLPVIVPS